MAQGRSHLSFHFHHPIHGHAHCCLSVLFLLTFYFLLYFSFLLFLFMANSSDSMNLNTLRNFANGTFVTLDDCLPDTDYEPNAMELTDVMEFTGTTELNDAASSDINFRDSLDYTAPFVRPLHRRRRARQATRRSTPRLRRLPPCGRCKC